MDRTNIDLERYSVPLDKALGDITPKGILQPWRAANDRLMAFSAKLVAKDPAWKTWAAWLRAVEGQLHRRIDVNRELRNADGLQEAVDETLAAFQAINIWWVNAARSGTHLIRGRKDLVGGPLANIQPEAFHTVNDLPNDLPNDLSLDPVLRALIVYEAKYSSVGAFIDANGDRFYFRARAIYLGSIGGLLSDVRVADPTTLQKASASTESHQRPEQLVPQAKQRGRKPNTGTIHDDPLIEEMHALIKENKAKSVMDAARKVANKAGGDGTLESKIDRLRHKYAEICP